MIFNLMKPVPTTESATMYSYNGTVLPKLPERDKTAYPYARIEQDLHYGKYFLRLYNGNLRVANDELFFTCYAGMESASYRIEDGVWAYWSVSGSPQDYTYRLNQAGVGYIFVWANHDILKEDGTVYLSASEPIPVYE